MYLWKNLTNCISGTNSKFDELFAKDSSFSNHDHSLQKLLPEIFGIKMNTAPEIVNGFFYIVECPYPIENELRFNYRNIRTVRCGIEVATFVGLRTWSYVPSELNMRILLNEFRSKIKTWEQENCLYKLYKIYLHRIDYLQVAN